MHPTQWAGQRPGHPAIVMAGSGETLSYGALEQFSNRGAQLFRKLGLHRGDVIALWCDNRLAYLPVCWAGERAGLAFVPISSRLTAREVLYILRDSGARALVLAPAIGAGAQALAREIAGSDPAFAMFTLDGSLPGCSTWDDAVAALPSTPIADQAPGRPMLYSSGTTGVPKGIVHADRPGTILDEHPYEVWLRNQYGFDGTTIFLSPAPFYHAAPLLFCLTVHRMGGTVVAMEQFDAERCLATIAGHGVTHVQLVPTMFVRLMRLPQAVRDKYDLSSLRCVIHAGSPCPSDVKRAMIEWLGPIIHEYYGASEGFGRTSITSHEALAKPGSVGRATQGILHLCDETGLEVGAGKTGLVYFESDIVCSYHGDPDKTAAAQHPDHPNWRTLGDIGHVDEDGFLFLTDRRAFTIISGGVNIYPQEAENILSTHPAVADVGVIGVPDPEMGEAVLAVVELADGADGGPELEAQLIAWCRDRLAHYKCPRRILFDAAFPREPTGKLFKKALRERYSNVMMQESASRR